MLLIKVENLTYTCESPSSISNFNSVSCDSIIEMSVTRNSVLRNLVTMKKQHAKHTPRLCVSALNAVLPNLVAPSRCLILMSLFLSRWREGNHHRNAPPGQAEPADRAPRIPARGHVQKNERTSGISAGTERSRRRSFSPE
jgi:hypothetical protein